MIIDITKRWQPYWPEEIDRCVKYHNLRRFEQYAHANDYVVMYTIWGAVAMMLTGKIMAYFEKPKPLHPLGALPADAVKM